MKLTTLVKSVWPPFGGDTAAAPLAGGSSRMRLTGLVRALWPPFSGGAGNVVAIGDLRQALYTRLTSSAALLAAVGADGIYPAVIPIGSQLPAATFHVPTNPRIHGLTGFHRAAVAEVTFNFASWSISDVVAAKAAVENLLDGKRWTANGVEVLWSVQVSEEDLHEPPADASDRWLYRIVVRYRVKHRPAPLT